VTDLLAAIFVATSSVAFELAQLFHGLKFRKREQLGSDYVNEVWTKGHSFLTALHHKDVNNFSPNSFALSLGVFKKLS